MKSSILRNVGSVTLLMLLQLASQFALQIVIAHRFGATASMDAFNAALTLPTTLTTIFMVSLSYVLIPTLTPALTADRHNADAWRLATAVGSWCLLMSGAVSLLLMIGSPIAIRWACPGFDGATQQIAISCLRILAWQFLLGVFVSWICSVENAAHGFSWPAFSMLISSVINLFLAYQWLPMGIEGYAWSIIASGVIQVGLLILPIYRNLWMNWRLFHPQLSQVVYRWLPLLIGGAYVRIDPIVDRYLGSAMDEGSIAHLGYAQRFIQAILAIATGGLLTVLFPKLTSDDPSNPKKGMQLRLRLGLHGLIVIIVPVVMGGYFFADWTVRDLLERGRFLPEDTQAVAKLFQILLIMFAGASIADLFARGHYSLGQTWPPTLFTSAAITLAFASKFYFARPLGSHGLAFGIDALAWCTSSYFVLITLLLACSLSQQVGLVFELAMLKSLGLACVVSMLACGIAWWISSSISPLGALASIPFAAAFYSAVLYPYVRNLASRLARN